MNSNHDNAVPRCVLAVAAHPDDLEFSCAGTLALWAKLGARIIYLICTSGEAGFDQPGLSREERIAIREAEQRAAAEVLGVNEVVFLREPDGLLQPTLKLRRKIVRKNGRKAGPGRRDEICRDVQSNPAKQMIQLCCPSNKPICYIHY